jgi:hypothetical protein
MTSVAAYTVFAKVEDIWPEQVLQTVAVVGSLYAGWLSMQDIGPWLESGGSYQLYLPSCVYGLAFYLVIFALSSKLVSAAKRAARGEPAATAPVETVRDNGDASVEK